MGLKFSRKSDEPDMKKSIVLNGDDSVMKCEKLVHIPDEDFDLNDFLTIQPSYKLSNPVIVDFSGSSINVGQVILEPCSILPFHDTDKLLRESLPRGIWIYRKADFPTAKFRRPNIMQLSIEAPTTKLEKDNLLKIKNHENDLRRSYYIRCDKLGKKLFYLTGSCATIGASCKIDFLNSEPDELTIEGKLLLKKIDEMELCKDTVKIGQLLLEFIHILKLTILRPDFVKYERRNGFENLFRLIKELSQILIRVHNKQYGPCATKSKCILMGGDV